MKKLPTRWAIRLTKENQHIVGQWFDKNVKPLIGYNGSYADDIWIDYFLHFPKCGFQTCTCSKVYYPEYEEISTSEFKSLILSDLKIIGYKFKPGYQELYENAANAIVGTLNISSFVKDGYQFTSDSMAAERLQKNNVLDLWFDPVYEDEFKIGDLVYVVNDYHPKYSHENEKESQYENRIGSFYGKNTGFNEDEYPYKVIFEESDVPDLPVYCHKIRKATAEDIKQSKTFMLGDYEVEFFKDGAIPGIRIYNDFYSLTRLNEIQNICKMERFHSMRFGCQGQIEINLEIITKIINRFK